GLGRTLAERGGLPLAGADGLLQLPGQFGDPGFEFGDTLEEFPAAGTRGLVHAAIVVTGTPVSGASASPAGSDRRGAKQVLGGIGAGACEILREAEPATVFGVKPPSPDLPPTAGRPG